MLTHAYVMLGDYINIIGLSSANVLILTHDPHLGALRPGLWCLSLSYSTTGRTFPLNLK